MDVWGKEWRVIGWKLICPRTLRSFYKRLGTESRMSLGKNSHMITKRNNFISMWKPYPCANKSVLGKSSAHCRGKVDCFVKQRPFQIKQACWVAVWILVCPPPAVKDIYKKIHIKKNHCRTLWATPVFGLGLQLSDNSEKAPVLHAWHSSFAPQDHKEDNFYVLALSLFCQSNVSRELGMSSLTCRVTMQGPWMNKKVKATPSWKFGGRAKSPELGSLETKSISRQRLPRGKWGQTSLWWDVSKMAHSRIHSGLLAMSSLQ